MNDGTLRVDSSTGTGATSINSGARLQGVGSLAATTTIFSGGTLAPGNSAGTITFAYLTMNAGSVAEFELDTPGTTGSGVNDFIVVTHNLALDATFNFTNLGGLGAGTYHLISYGGSYTGTPVLGTVPAGFGGYQIVAGGGFVDLIVSPFATGSQYWDGGDFVGGNAVDGGTGTWNIASQNWTTPSGSTNTNWASDTAVFAGLAAGTVTVVGQQECQQAPVRDRRLHADRRRRPQRQRRRCRDRGQRRFGHRDHQHDDQRYQPRQDRRGHARAGRHQHPDRRCSRDGGYPCD